MRVFLNLVNLVNLVNLGKPGKPLVKLLSTTKKHSSKLKVKVEIENLSLFLKKLIINVKKHY